MAYAWRRLGWLTTYLGWSIVATSASADSLPLWELGLGPAVLDVPDYRGASERHTFLLPFPYLEYRGKFLKADRERIRGVVFKSHHVELNFSVNGSTPVYSSDNQARQGMPNLDPTLEFGPNLEVNLWRSTSSQRSLDLRLPLRGVIATNFRRAHDVGWVFQPQLNADLKGLGPDGRWRIGLAAGPLFATHRFHQYFYGVEAPFATATRPAYDAPGGRSGAQVTLALSKRYSRFWFGGFARYDRLDGAAFNDSPLAQSRESFAAGFAVAWIFARSTQQVETDQ